MIWLPKLTDVPPISGLTYGIIKKICCVGKKIISRHLPPQHAPIVDIFVELFIITDYNDLNLLVNSKPLSLLDGTYEWQCGPSPPYLCTPPIQLFYVLFPHTPAGNLNSARTIESVRIFQGTCEDNQTTGNKTKLLQADS